MRHIYTGEYHSAIKRKIKLPIHIIWANLKNAMLSERRQTQKRIYSIIPLTWNSRIDSSNLVTENRSMAVWGLDWGRGQGLPERSPKGLLRGDGMFYILFVVVTWAVYFFIKNRLCTCHIHLK